MNTSDATQRLRDAPAPYEFSVEANCTVNRKED